MIRAMKKIGLIALLSLVLNGCGVDAEKYESCVTENISGKIHSLNKLDQGSTREERTLFKTVKKEVGKEKRTLGEFTKSELNRLNNIIERNQNSIMEFMEVVLKGTEQCSVYFDKSNPRNQKLSREVQKSLEQAEEVSRKLSDMKEYVSFH